jgi:hypothetical protein
VVESSLEAGDCAEEVAAKRVARRKVSNDLRSIEVVQSLPGRIWKEALTKLALMQGKMGWIFNVSVPKLLGNFITHLLIGGAQVIPKGIFLGADDGC